MYYYHKLTIYVHWFQFGPIYNIKRGMKDSKRGMLQLSTSYQMSVLSREALWEGAVLLEAALPFRSIYLMRKHSLILIEINMIESI